MAMLIHVANSGSLSVEDASKHCMTLVRRGRLGDCYLNTCKKINNLTLSVQTIGLKIIAIVYLFVI